jgi:RimJ/RimL family protein N-acetyltransferase
MRAGAKLFRTERTVIRTAGPADAEVFFRLWTDPRVMVNVGFPKGLPITHPEVENRMREEQEASIYERRLVVVRSEDGELMGECALHRPDEEGIARTDIKLLPEFWGHKYGQEVKRGLLTYLFAHTDCRAVEATPNVENIASIKMQESVGGRRVGEGVFEFPAEMADYTSPVRHYIYLVYREDWQKLTGQREA